MAEASPENVAVPQVSPRSYHVMSMNKHGMSGPGGPSPNNWVRNIRKPMPAGRKLKYISRNVLTRLVKLQNCCGHPGQPGC